MGCSSCGIGTDGKPRGCMSNGSCTTGGCEKLSVFDWLSNMALPNGESPFNIYEVRFKNGRKHFFKNTEGLIISIGDVVVVGGNPGHDVGVVSLSGELVKIQMRKSKIFFDDESIRKIYRKATQKDINVWQKARSRELETQTRGREIVGHLGLKMKLSDVEFQGDGNKATFYYTADTRVDFRQLIKDLASAFSIRIEMKQVGARQEAARLGGVGSCGRELCCSTWLTDFRKVTTITARYQQLSLNPLKLAGQCGKLKCCLNFELDTYLDALDAFPKQNKVLKTEKGDAMFVKMDIFKKLLWYTYKEDRIKWHKLTLDQVQEIIGLNENNELGIPLEEYELEIEEAAKINFENAVGQDSLTRFDTPKKSIRRRKKRNHQKKSLEVTGARTPKQRAQKQNKTSNNQNQSKYQQKRQDQNKQPNKRRRNLENNGNRDQGK